MPREPREPREWSNTCWRYVPYERDDMRSESSQRSFDRREALKNDVWILREERAAALSEVQVFLINMNPYRWSPSRMLTSVSRKQLVSAQWEYVRKWVVLHGIQTIVRWIEIPQAIDSGIDLSRTIDKLLSFGCLWIKRYQLRVYQPTIDKEGWLIN
jgi:hypothetical protein